MVGLNEVREERLLFLLNSGDAGTLPPEDQLELGTLVSEYYSDDQNPDTGWDSDSDFEENLTENDENSDNVEDGGVNEPLVQVGDVDPNGHNGVCSNMSVDDDVPAILQRARERCCKANGKGCSQIKVLGPAAEDPRKGCITQFTPEEIVALQLSVHDMDRDAKDMMILGILSSCMRNGPKTECSKWKLQNDRQRPRSSYSLLSRLVCKDAFLFLLGISQNLLTRLHKHYQSEGLTPPTRRAGGRKNNTRSLALEDTEAVTRFLKHYAEDNAISLPGRVPGFKRDDIRLLPSAVPKSGVYRLYADHAARTGVRVVGASTFRKLWIELCPYIVVAKPMTDLCWRCQSNNTMIYRSANMTVEEKHALLVEHQSHLSQVDAERQFYRQMTGEAKAVVQQRGIVKLQPTPANTGDFAMHYSFDYAQQVHYPSMSGQPGPIYFMTPRKCGIFGVCCEGLPQQVNYLIDESVNVSKGSNAVISYMHHFFEQYGLGEKEVHLHCDNCSGQNKNRYMIWYLSWRVQRGLHTEVTVNFMPPGHTKFAPDWCFGLLKRCFRRQDDVSCLEDIERVVRMSTPVSGVNIPQRVGSENGTVEVPTYDWQSYLSPAYRVLPAIKSISHLRFSAQSPGKVFFKHSIAEMEQEHLLSVGNSVERLPPMPRQVPPPGLSQARKQYLFQNIRQFVRENVRDIVCPNPDI